jgi:hypothetical protein
MDSLSGDAVMLGFFLAWVVPFLVVDFLSGFIHWIEDTYFSETTPIIGQWIIRPNREHHTHPMAFTTSSLWARNSLLIYAAIAVATATWLLGGLTFPWAIAFAAGGFANEIHYWTHATPTKVPRAVRVLQAARILQTRKHHLVGHHQSPYDGNYCAILNVLNPLLDGLRFWRGLEVLVAAVSGVRPRAYQTSP